MTNEPLPPELAELEASLTRRTVTPGPGLRKRVLDAVAADLAAREGRAGRGHSFWKRMRPPESRGMASRPCCRYSDRSLQP